MLVNTGRSGLVDNGAVSLAIRTGRLRGYAVDDVFVCDGATDLVAEGRVLQTGHRAWWADETLARGAQMWAETLHAMATGTPVPVVTRSYADALSGTA